MLRRLLRTLMVLGLGLLAIPLFASPYVIEHSSMTPSISPGEIMLVDTAMPRLLGYRRGDIVVFQPPVPGYLGVPLIKRVVGLSGERISIHDGGVFVDGVRLSEGYVPSDEPTATNAAATWVVPAGSVFVLGDHRVNSWDSRGYGPVPETSIVGDAWLGFVPSFALTF